MNIKYYTYIIWSEKFKRKYVGITESIEKMLAEHNYGKTKSTKAYIPWKIIYFEFFNSRKEARQREIYFKTAAGRRFLKEKLKLQ